MICTMYTHSCTWSLFFTDIVSLPRWNVASIHVDIVNFCLLLWSITAYLGLLSKNIFVWNININMKFHLSPSVLNLIWQKKLDWFDWQNFMTNIIIQQIHLLSDKSLENDDAIHDLYWIPTGISIFSWIKFEKKNSLLKECILMFFEYNLLRLLFP